MPYGQLILGSPGAGKSTYCNGMQQFLGAIGRNVSVVNLDPANDNVSYQPAIDIRDLVTLEDVMEKEELGPNGGVLYALEELEENWEWLQQGLKECEDNYILIDSPGQVELFTHHESLRRIISRIQKMGYRLVAVHLVDSYNLTIPSLYISALLLAVRAMLQMELPHVNVLTKIDNLSSYGPLAQNLDFYTEVQDLSHLLPSLAAEPSGITRHPRFEGLNKAIIELIEDFGIVGFETLAVEDKKSMMTLLKVIDRAGGYVFGGAEGANDTVWQVAMREGFEGQSIRDVQERWIDYRDEWDEKERADLEAEAPQLESTDPVGSQIDSADVGDNVTARPSDECDGSDDDIEEWPRMADSGVKVIRKGQQ